MYRHRPLLSQPCYNIRIDLIINLIPKKILFFGASVTQQGVNHKTGEIVGYVPWIRRQIKDEGLNLIVKEIAAGSSHFDSAGYALLPQILREMPDLLILDWHTTGLASFSPILWHSFLSACLDKNIPVMIAILPRRSIYISKTKRPNQVQAEQVSCNAFQILDGYKFKSFDPEVHLRDEVHATPEGGKFYASNMLNYLKMHPAISANKVDGSVDCVYSSYVKEEERPSAFEFVAESREYVKHKKVKIKYKADSVAGEVRLVVDARVGPDSPTIVIRYNLSKKDTGSLWDPWCHYERQTYKQFNLLSDQSKVTIKVGKDIPDYESCVNKEFDFSGTIGQDKYICCRDLYMIGGTIESVEYV